MLYCVTLGKSVPLSKPQSLHLQKGMTPGLLSGVLRGNCLLIRVKHLAHRQRSFDQSQPVEIRLTGLTQHPALVLALTLPEKGLLQKGDAVSLV